MTTVLQLLILTAAVTALLTVVPRFRHRRLATIAQLSMLAFVLTGLLSLGVTFGFRGDVVALTAEYCAALAAIVALVRQQGAAVQSFVLATMTIFSIGYVWACRMIFTGQSSPTRVALFLFAALFFVGLALTWRGFNGLLDAVPAPWLGLTGILLIALPLFSGGYKNGAFINFSLPVIGSVQPGEVGRLLLVLWLARSVASHRALLVISTTTRNMVAAMWMITAPVVVGVGVGIVSNDLGPALLLVIASLIIVFVGGLGWRYVALVLGVGVAGIGAVVLLSGKVAGRFASLADPLGAELRAPLEQIGLGLAAMAHGPTGLGQGVERTVPEWNTDMLPVSIAHEMGMGQLIAVLLTLIVIAVATWQLVGQLHDDRHQLRVVGVSAMLATQTLLMLTAVFSLAPLTGMPVPFLSFSGSSMVATGLASALVLSAWPATGGTRGSATVRNRTTLWVGITTLLCLAMLVKAVSLAASASETIDAVRGRDPVANKLALIDAGDIVTADGTLIASTVTKQPTEPLRVSNAQREYPFEMYRNVLGSVSFPGLEHAIVHEQTCFLGNCEATAVTLRHEVQQVAWEGLQGRTGSVVAVDLETGEIIAYAARVEGGEELEPDLIRSHTVAPGSVAKIVSGAAAAQYSLPLERPYLSEFNGIRALGGDACGGNLSSAMAVSCNPYFASIGHDLGPRGLIWASYWLTAQDSVSGMSVSDSRLMLPGDGDDFAALGAIGLGNARVTPFGLLSATAQIARGGTAICMSLLIDDDASCIHLSDMEEEAADIVATAMREVVRSGTARNVPGIHEIDAAAKTGTADIDGDLTNATFVAFGPASAPRYAVAVVIEPGPAAVKGLVGSRDAGPVAVEVLTRALELSS